MRTCEGCQYLVPEGWEVCKRCGAALSAGPPPSAAPIHAAPEPVPAFAASRSASPAPATVHAAPPPAFAPLLPHGSGTDPMGYAAPVRLGFPGPVGDGLEHPPTAASQWSTPAAPPKGQSPLRAVLTVIFAVSGFVGGWYGWQHLTAEKPPAELAAYIDGEGVEYAPLGGGYRVSLPTTPSETQQSLTVAGIPVTLDIAMVSSGDDYAMGVMSTRLPAQAAGMPTEPVLDGAVEGAAAATDGTIKSRESVTHDGHPAIDVVVSTAPGDIHARVVLTATHMYVVLVGATAGGEDAFEHLVETFEIDSGTTF